MSTTNDRQPSIQLAAAFLIILCLFLGVGSLAYHDLAFADDAAAPAAVHVGEDLALAAAPETEGLEVRDPEGEVSEVEISEAETLEVKDSVTEPSEAEGVEAKAPESESVEAKAPEAQAFESEVSEASASDEIALEAGNIDESVSGNRNPGTSAPSNRAPGNPDPSNLASGNLAPSNCDLERQDLDEQAAQDSVDATLSPDGSSAFPAPGSYLIRTTLADTQLIDIAGGSKANGARAQIWQCNQSAAQRFELYVDADGLCTLVNAGSGKALDVQWGQARPGASVWQYQRNGSTAQKWQLVEQGGGWSLRSALNRNLALDVSGANAANGTPLVLWAVNGTAAQRFAFMEAFPNVAPSDDGIESGVYTLFCATGSSSGGAPGATGGTTSGSGVSGASGSNLVLDVKGASLNDGAQVQTWKRNASQAQCFLIRPDGRGFHTIMCLASFKYLDLRGGLHTAGTTVQQWTGGSVNQSWSIQMHDDGTYAIVSAVSGMALDAKVQLGAGVGVVVNYSDERASQRWVLQPDQSLRYRDDFESGFYRLASALDEDKVVDISGGSIVDGANVQLYTDNTSAAQRFYLVNDAGAYVLRNCRSGKVLDVKGGGTAAGTNVQQYAANGTAAQKWFAFECADGCISFLSAKSGCALDVAGASTKDGANLQIYRFNGTAAQRFRLVRVADSHALAQFLATGDVASIRLVGDSITEGYGCSDHITPTDETSTRLVFDDGEECYYEEPADAARLSFAGRFRSYLEDRYPEIDLFNAGIGKKTMTFAATKMDAWIPEPCDVCFVMLGTNDVLNSSTVDAFFEASQKVLSSAAERSSLLVVLSPVQVYDVGCFGMTVEQADSALREICDRNGWLHLSLLRLTGLDRGCYNDDIHPNDTGHLRIWDTIRSELFL